MYIENEKRVFWDWFRENWLYKFGALYSNHLYLQQSMVQVHRYWKLTSFFTSKHLKISMKSEFWWPSIEGISLWIKCCGWEICGNLTNGFFPLHICKVSHVCRGIKTRPIEGKYLLDTSENSHFRPNLSEDLQQCDKRIKGETKVRYEDQKRSELKWWYEKTQGKEMRITWDEK